jgi:cardiolipin synthase
LKINALNFLKKFLFHRVFFIFIALTLQLLVLVAVIIRFNNSFTIYYGASILISTIAVLWIINNKSNPAYKISWIITALVLPIFGGLYYIFFGGNKLSNRAKKKMKSIGEKTSEALKPQPLILTEIESYNEAAAIQSRYIQNFGHYPPYNYTRAEYLPSGEIKFERLKEKLRKAEHYIFLEYFIIEKGLMWDSILEILVEKVQQGVDVRIIYDDAGCLMTLPNRYDKKLEKMGIKCCVFSPMIPVLSTKLNKRDHRKIVVIDGRTGFTGGINLADEYINKIVKYGHWKDTAIMLEGEAVWSLTVMFLSMWNYLRGRDEDFNQYQRNTSDNQEICGDGYYQPFADSPLDDEPFGEIIYLNIINKARKYICITTPYLIIDNEMVIALSSAAKGGVDIRIITPAFADKWYVHEMTKSYYKGLIESGVKIYEYTPGFIHSKTFVADDEYGVVGTINMDYRSFYLQFECGVWIYQSSILLDMKADFLNTLQMCKEITLEDFKDLKLKQVITNAILRVFAHFM